MAAFLRVRCAAAAGLSYFGGSDHYIRTYAAERANVVDGIRSMPITFCPVYEQTVMWLRPTEYAYDFLSSI